MKKLSVVFILLLHLSCSRIHFKSNKEIKISFDQLKGHEESVVVQVSKPFYMWGLVPGTQVIELDTLFVREGFDSISSLDIKEIKTSQSTWWGILTFGMYYPKTYALSGKIVNQ